MSSQQINKFGFPRTGPKGAKQIFGFQTGDIVIAKVIKGKKSGKYIGRVVVRASAYFDIKTFVNTKVLGINARYFKLIQRTDGYSYAIGA